jgi:hypothetical protein
MAAAVFVELMWSLPVVALTIAMKHILRNISPAKRIPLVIGFGVAIGVLYSLGISGLAGPMVSGATIPLLPFMTTIGAIVGFLEVARIGRIQLHVYGLVALIAVIWGGYFALADMLASSNAVSVVIVKRVPTSGSARWDVDEQSIVLTEDERTRIQEQLGSDDAGILRPVLSFSEGEHPHVTVIAVMIKDVSSVVRLPIPHSGLAVFVQNQDGTWREDLHATHPSKNKLNLFPIAENNHTRVEIENSFDTQSSEVSILTE